MKRLVVRVFGSVQGVFYRHSARMRAEKLGLTGWARNEEGGSVAITAEGEEQALNEFLDWCRTGPPLANVKRMEVDWGEATGEFRRFEIL